MGMSPYSTFYQAYKVHHAKKKVFFEEQRKVSLLKKKKKKKKVSIGDVIPFLEANPFENQTLFKY